MIVGDQTVDDLSAIKLARDIATSKTQCSILAMIKVNVTAKREQLSLLNNGNLLYEERRLGWRLIGVFLVYGAD